MNAQILIMSIFVIGFNGLWYWNKKTLNENGYPVSWFFNHFSDIPNMFELAKKTEDPKLRRKYLIRAWLIPLAIPTMFILFIVV